MEKQPKPPAVTPETEFERFEQLARKIANVPKEKVREKPSDGGA